MSLSKREKILISFLLVLGLVYFFDNFSYKPMAKERSRLLKENAALEKTIEQGETARAKRINGEKQALKLNKAFEELLPKLPIAAEVPESISFLEKCSQETGVTLLKIKYLPLSKTPNASKNRERVKAVNESELDQANKISFSLSARGEYNNLLAFLLRIENAPRIYVISNCQMKASREKPEQAAVDQALPEGLDSNSSLPALSPPSQNDAKNIILNLEIFAYYDKNSIEGTSEIYDDLQPVPTCLNPFQ